jgi:hypothetical protein
MMSMNTDTSPAFARTAHFRDLDRVATKGGSCSAAMICVSVLPSSSEMSALGESDLKASFPSPQKGTNLAVLLLPATRSGRSVKTVTGLS